MTDATRPTLAETGQVYVTLSAAKRFAAQAGYADHEIESARRELTELALDAKQSQSDSSRWRARRRSTDLDISLIVACEGRLLVVTSINVRAYDPPSTTSRGSR